MKEGEFIDYLVNSGYYLSPRITMDGSLIEDYIENVLDNCDVEDYQIELCREALLCITANLLWNFSKRRGTFISSSSEKWESYRKQYDLQWCNLKRVQKVLDALVETGNIHRDKAFHRKYNKYMYMNIFTLKSVPVGVFIGNDEAFNEAIVWDITKIKPKVEKVPSFFGGVKETMKDLKD